MSKKVKKESFQGGIVYSTNPNFFIPGEENGENKMVPPDKQKLRVYIDSRNRKGKTVTLINGFAGTEDELRNLEKALKNFCGTGGSSKDGEILLQGDQREKVIGFLKGKGYGVRR